MMKFLYSSSTVLAGAILVSLAAPLQAASDVMTFQVETGLASPIVLNDSAETKSLHYRLISLSLSIVPPLCQPRRSIKSARLSSNLLIP